MNFEFGDMPHAFSGMSCDARGVDFVLQGLFIYAYAHGNTRKGRCGYVAKDTTGFLYDGFRRFVAAALCGVVTVTHANQAVAVLFDELAGALGAGPANGANQHTPPFRGMRHLLCYLATIIERAGTRHKPSKRKGQRVLAFCVV